MSEPRFRLGGGGLGTDRVFDLSETSEPVTDEQVKEFQETHDFLPDAQVRFERTLEKNGYRHVTKLDNGVRYPSLNEWVARKVSTRESWVRAYPAFVTDAKGEMFFCKVRIKPKEKVLGKGFSGEADLLWNMKDLPAAKFVHYIPEDEASGELEMIVLEPIKFSEGSVLLPQEWTNACAAAVVTQIKRLEQMPFDAMDASSQTSEQLIEHLTSRVGVMLQDAMRATVEQVLEEYKQYGKPAFVHRDLWSKNIIFGNNLIDPSVRFIDWELGGAGFVGEDVGRMWWGITAGTGASPEVRKTVLSEYIDASSPEMHEAQRTQLRFGVVLELLWRLDDKSEAVTRTPALLKDPSMQSYIEAVHDQANRMLREIDEHRS